MHDQKEQEETSSGPDNGRPPPTADGDPRWVVLKFGGTSVASLAGWRTIHRAVEEQRRAGRRPVVVCSALSQVSNRLEAMLTTAEEETDFMPVYQQVVDQHVELGAAMGLDARQLLADLLDDLVRILKGVQLTGEATPRTRARVLSVGELMSTRLGFAWLVEQGIDASWMDARELLEADQDPASRVAPERQYLSATCSHEPDPELERRLVDAGGEAVITQGFIADLDGDTVLLGRGGSDTAAAYMAGKLAAERLEIWTDVPGMFTANPHQIPEARLLLSLSYLEAGELAAKGAKVLHPRSIRAAKEAGIPIHLRSTAQPELAGTVISDRHAAGEPRLKAVSERDGIVLVSMDVEGDWQPVGLIADIAACFKEHGLSIDLLTSSQTNFGIALDPTANHLDPTTMAPLLRQLEELCSPQLIEPVSAVSLVGTGIREILHEWGELLTLFEDTEVHMVSQAANDLSLTLVVDESDAGAMVEAVHGQLFGSQTADAEYLGPSWEELNDA